MGMEENTFELVMLGIIGVIFLTCLAYSILKKRGEILSNERRREQREKEVDAKLE